MRSYPDIKNYIQNILDCNLPVVTEDCKRIILDKIMTMLREEGCGPEGFTMGLTSRNYLNSIFEVDRVSFIQAALAARFVQVFCKDHICSDCPFSDNGDIECCELRQDPFEWNLIKVVNKCED